jgi:hypothetical protein
LRYDLIVLILSTIASYPLGLWLARPWLLPFVNLLPGYLVLLHRLRKGERGGAVRAMLWWAAALALSGTILFVWWPHPIDTTVFHGPDYKQEMFRWIRSGHGAEGSLGSFLPQQLLQLALFVALGFATVGAGAMLLGVVVMNETSYYVAALARAGVPPWAVTLLGWQPWAIARAAALATLAVILSEPLLFRVFPSARARLKWPGRAPYVVAAISGILAGWFLRALLAPLWGHWLRALLP